MITTAVIDYGMGNLHSVAKALERVAPVNMRIVVTSEPQAVLAADRVVFPGVGAVRDCMSGLQHLALDEVLRRCFLKKPVLGICLGMQALFDSSEENQGTPGLGLLAGEVKRFRYGAGHDSLKIPHMGWNEVFQVHPHPLWRGIAERSRFYFVHSYYVAPTVRNLVAGEAIYGFPFTAAVSKDNLFAVQFHPEKSQAAGLKLLENFLIWDGA